MKPKCVGVCMLKCMLKCRCCKKALACKPIKFSVQQVPQVHSRCTGRSRSLDFNSEFIQNFCAFKAAKHFPRLDFAAHKLLSAHTTTAAGERIGQPGGALTHPFVPTSALRQLRKQCEVKHA